MICDTINFLLVFLVDTGSYETVIKQECWKKESSTESSIVYEIETSFDKIDIISYDNEKQIYYAKLKTK